MSFLTVCAISVTMVSTGSCSRTDNEVVPDRNNNISIEVLTEQFETGSRASICNASGTDMQLLTPESSESGQAEPLALSLYSTGYSDLNHPVQFTKGNLLNSWTDDEGYFSGFFELQLLVDYNMSDDYDINKLIYNSYSNTWNLGYGHIWPDGQKMSFYAYNTYHNGAEWSYSESSASADGFSLEIDGIQSKAVEQEDILVGGYVGYGNWPDGATKTARIRMGHALAAVRFQFSNPDLVVYRIEIDGVYDSGICNVSVSEDDGSVSTGWPEKAGSKTVFDEMYRGSLLRHEDRVGEYFILIPQDFSEQPVSLRIWAYDADGVQRTYSGTVSSGVIEAGKINTFSIYSPTGTGDITVSGSWFGESTDL